MCVAKFISRFAVILALVGASASLSAEERVPWEVVELSYDTVKWKFVTNDVWMISMGGVDEQAKTFTAGAIYRGQGELDLTKVKEDTGYAVTVLSYHDYQDDNLKKLAQGLGLSLVAKSAFTGIVLPEETTFIRQDTYEHCPNLGRVIAPGVTEVRDGAFAAGTIVEKHSRHNQCQHYVSSLTNVVLSENLTTIGYGAFVSNTNLTHFSPQFPATLTSVGYCAFSGCPLEGELKLESLTTIEEEAFAYGCYTSVVFSADLQTIGQRAFLGDKTMSRLGSLPKLPASCQTVSRDSFSSQLKLAGVIDFSSCTNLRILGQAAFNSAAITECRLPPALTNLQYGVFDGCASLTNVVATVPTDAAILKDMRQADGFIGYRVFANCTQLRHVEVPWGGVTRFEYVDYDDAQPTGSKWWYAPFGNTPLLESVWFFGKAVERGPTQYGFFSRGGKNYANTWFYCSKKMDQAGWLGLVDAESTKGGFGVLKHSHWAATGQAQLSWKKSPLDPVSGMAIILK